MSLGFKSWVRCFSAECDKDRRMPSSPSLHNLIEIQFWHVHSPLQGLSFSSYSWMINQHLDALCCASWKFLPPASEPGLLGGMSVCMGAILKFFFMAPSHAASAVRGIFQSPCCLWGCCSPSWHAADCPGGWGAAVLTWACGEQTCPIQAWAPFA